MGYSDNHVSESRWSLKKVGGLVVAIIAFSIAKAVATSGVQFFKQKTTSSEQVESSLENDTRFAATFVEFRRDFPDDYHRLTTEVAALIRNGSSETEISQHGYSLMQGFLRTHMSEITESSDATLSSIAAAQSAVANALATENQDECAEFSDTGLQPGTQFSDATLRKVAEITRLMIVAAHEGAFHPVSRTTNNVIRPDAVELVNGMRQYGLSQEQLKLFAGGMQSASVPDKCQVGVAIYRTLADMPKATGARLTAFFLAQGAKSSALTS